MPMPGSGQISLDDARDEFDVGGQISLGDLYRGGSLVPDVSVNSGVPTSGEIGLSDLYGAADEQVTVSGSSTISSFNQSAQVRFNSDGTVDAITNSGTTQLSASTDWIIPNDAAPGTYQIRATLTSGSTPDGGTLDTWLAMTISRVWTLSPPGTSGTRNCTLLIEMRDGTGPVIDSGSYPLESVTA